MVEVLLWFIAGASILYLGAMLVLIAIHDGIYLMLMGDIHDTPSRTRDRVTSRILFWTPIALVLIYLALGFGKGFLT